MLSFSSSSSPLRSSSFELAARLLSRLPSPDPWRLTHVCDQPLLLKTCKIAPNTVIEYHVLHNLSYGVPVLHLTVSDATGAPVDPAGVDCLANMWSKQYLTQQMHPLIPNLATWQVHPCNTQLAMDTLVKEDNSCYLISWLSLVGPHVGMHVQPELMLLYRESLEKARNEAKK